MIRLFRKEIPAGTFLEAEGRSIHNDPDPVHVLSESLLDHDKRREQAFLLIDAAAALLEDDDEFIGEFDELHEIMDRVRGE